MSDVVEFKRPDPLVWVCRCGCTTWYARSDGVLQCAGCDNVSTDGPSGWRETLRDDQDGEVEDTWKMIGGQGVEFWLRRFAKPSIRAAILIQADGRPVTWAHNLSDDEREAFKAAMGRL